MEHLGELVVSLGLTVIGPRAVFLGFMPDFPSAFLFTINAGGWKISSLNRKKNSTLALPEY